MSFHGRRQASGTRRCPRLPTTTENPRVQPMKMLFRRTGGFVAAPGLQVEATVTVDPGHGEVTADKGYRRVLDAAERAGLLGDLSSVARAAPEPHPSAGRAPDAYRFRFWIENGPEATTIELDGSERSSNSSVARLVEWASREADAIVRARFRN